jgi:hypothetical protein
MDSHLSVRISTNLIRFFVLNSELFGPLNPIIGTEGGYLIEYLPFLQEGYALRSTIIYLLELYHRVTGYYDRKILQNFANAHMHEVDLKDNPQVQARLILEYEIVKGTYDKSIL